MARMGSKQAGRRARRQFSEGVHGRLRLVLDEGKTIGAVARELDDAVAREVLGRRGRIGQVKTGLRPKRHGASAAAQGESRATDGARHPKKRRPSSPNTRRFAWRRRPDHETLSDVARAAASRARPESTHARDVPSTESAGAGVLRRKQRYGSPRVHEDLLEQHEHVSRKRVVRLMHRLRKRYTVTTMSDHDQPVAANLLDREESTVGRRHDGVRHRRQRQAAIGGPAICSRGSSWGGPSGGPPGDHQGAPDGD